MSVRFLHHAKCGRLCRELRIPRWQALGIMQAIWDVAAEDRQIGETGEFAGWTAEDFAWAIDYQDDAQRLLDTLVRCRLLDLEGETYRIHDWQDWCPRHIQERKRQRHKRGSDGDGNGQLPNVGNSCQPLAKVGPTETEPKPKPTETNRTETEDAREVGQGDTKADTATASGCADSSESERLSGSALSPDAMAKSCVTSLAQCWPLEFAGSTKEGDWNRKTFRRHVLDICQRDGPDACKAAVRWVVAEAQRKRAAAKVGELRRPIAALNQAVIDHFGLGREVARNGGRTHA